MTKATVRAIDTRPADRTVTCFPKRARKLPILAETAHDLNNAFSAILLQFDLLAHDVAAHECGSTDKLRQRLRQLQPAVQHAAEISQQLMYPGGLRTDTGTAYPWRTALNPALQRMVPILSAMLPPGVDLHLRLASDLGMVVIDPVRIVRIVSNLVLNSSAALARAASRGTGSVTIETTLGRDLAGVVLRVRDTGPGMSATTRANLFRPYFTTKPRSGSAGLGMASVLRMVRRAKGAIQIESSPGHGTEVTITFPTSTAHSRLPSKKPSQASRRVPYIVARERNSSSKSGAEHLQLSTKRSKKCLPSEPAQPQLA